MTKVDWIKCSDRMPNIGELVLAWTRDDDLKICALDHRYEDPRSLVWDTGADIDWKYDLGKITHWAEMIEGPDERA